MLDPPIWTPTAGQREQAGPLEAHLDAMIASLGALGYSPATVETFTWAISLLGRWLVENELMLDNLDDSAVEAFLGERASRGKLHRSLRAAAEFVLQHLWRAGVAPARSQVCRESPIDQIMERYVGYLRVERGLTEATVVNYMPFVHRLLVERFGEQPLNLRDLRTRDIQGFLLRHTHSLSPGRAKVVGTALRSFLRFLLMQGEIDVDLAAAVLSVADRRATMPKYIRADEVERMLSSVDRGPIVGRRDYAILLLLARLGLRGGEVVALELGDINWRAGEITVPGKGLRRERLPLPNDVGEAIATYLQGRPRTSLTRRVFIRARAPHDGLGHPSTIGTIVSRALARAGLHPPSRGAHMLRHSLATRMIREGASMAEIGQVLRHHSPQTTERYAKVDVEGLRALALAWPGAGGGP